MNKISKEYQNPSGLTRKTKTFFMNIHSCSDDLKVFDFNLKWAIVLLIITV
jgi:hypothetical protein